MFGLMIFGLETYCLKAIHLKMYLVNLEYSNPSSYIQKMVGLLLKKLTHKAQLDRISSSNFYNFDERST